MVIEKRTAVRSQNGGLIVLHLGFKHVQPLMYKVVGMTGIKYLHYVSILDD